MDTTSGDNPGEVLSSLALAPREAGLRHGIAPKAVPSLPTGTEKSTESRRSNELTLEVELPPVSESNSTENVKEYEVPEAGDTFLVE